MATKSTDEHNEAASLDAFTELVRAADSLSAKVGKQAGNEGLTTTQFAALEALFHEGALRQWELAERLLKSGANITAVVDQLEARGLLIRRKEIGDRRSTTIELTPAGRSLIAEISPAHAEFISEQMSALNPEEQFILGELCRKLGLSLMPKSEHRGKAA